MSGVSLSLSLSLCVCLSTYGEGPALSSPVPLHQCVAVLLLPPSATAPPAAAAAAAAAAPLKAQGGGRSRSTGVPIRSGCALLDSCTAGETEGCPVCAGSDSESESDSGLDLDLEEGRERGREGVVGSVVAGPE